MSETSNESPPATNTSKNKKRFAIALAFVSLIAWRAYADYDYWTAAWKQKTLSPTLASSRRKKTDNTFDLTNTTIPPEEILAGGPPKDGIPALSDPVFISASAATYLQPTDRVIGISIDDVARAYPLRILNYHEVVNDRFDEMPVAVTYCPLCDSCAAFDRRTTLGETEFGVSGRLYNSNVLMFDRVGKTPSLWSQLKMQAVSGPAVQNTLTPLPLELTTWQDWLSRHPYTQVLSPETGHTRDYTRNPYARYFETPKLMFPAQPTDDRLPAKEPVLALWTKQTNRAYPLSSFSAEQNQLEGTLDGKKFTILFNPSSNSLRIEKADDGIHWLYTFWFAWYAMHPDTEVYSPKDSPSPDPLPHHESTSAAPPHSPPDRQPSTSSPTPQNISSVQNR